jgi:hypothetical protein
VNVTSRRSRTAWGRLAWFQAAGFNFALVLHLIDVQSIASRNSIDPTEGPSTVQRIVSLRRALMELIEATSDVKINGQSYPGTRARIGNINEGRDDWQERDEW